MSATAVALTILILGVFAVTVVYLDSTQGSADQIAQLKAQISQLSSQQKNFSASLASFGRGLPVMNQRPTQRVITVEWAEFLSQQDRFFTNYIVVNQGDTVDITFISNDTASHTFTIDAPYNFQINGSIAGTVNDETGKVFTDKVPANSSPGVVVSGTSGNVTATGSFVAKYAGVFEYYCIYHIHLGMFGYLVVLPNSAYGGTAAAATTTIRSIVGTHISILPGAGSPQNPKGFSAVNITLVIGVNNTVTWTNDDTVDHTATAFSGLFNSQNIQPGGAFTYTFTRPGTYIYGCEYHPLMRGTITVKG